MKKYDTIRMKKYSLYLFIVISCLIQGCYNDKGNYDYRSPPSREITGWYLKLRTPERALRPTKSRL